MSGFRLWRRWDPRLEAMPLREVQRTNRWCIEVVPDLFEPGNKPMCDAVLHAIGKSARNYRARDRGRFLIRTAHPGAAVARFRELRETYGHGTDAAEAKSIPARCILAVYAETQAELDARTAELRVPRPLYEKIALTDMDAAIVLALKERAISASYNSEEWQAAKVKGPEALSSYLKGIYRHSDARCTDFGAAGIALYLSPRSRIDVGVGLRATRAETDAFHAKYGKNTSYCSDHEGSHSPPENFEWILVAGKIGPIGKDETTGPWPIHPSWITEVAATAKEFEIPFCVPHLGEWSCFDHRRWAGDHTDSGGMSSCDSMGDRNDRDPPPTARVDYDPSWVWGERGWDAEHRGAKPSEAWMQAIGSHHVGRALLGRMFDEWPGWAGR